MAARVSGGKKAATFIGEVEPDSTFETLPDVTSVANPMIRPVKPLIGGVYTD